jgi:hypothetical protein
LHAPGKWCFKPPLSNSGMGNLRPLREADKAETVFPRAAAAAETSDFGKLES